MSPVYWKPKHGTRSSRHRAWARQDAKREAVAHRRLPLRERLQRFLQRR
jgi:hypothetical protein